MSGEKWLYAPILRDARRFFKHGKEIWQRMLRIMQEKHNYAQPDAGDAYMQLSGVY